MNIFTAVKYCCILHGRVFVMYDDVPTLYLYSSEHFTTTVSSFTDVNFNITTTVSSFADVNFNTQNEFLIVKRLKQGYRYHKLRKAFFFFKFYCR